MFEWYGFNEVTPQVQYINAAKNSLSMVSRVLRYNVWLSDIISEVIKVKSWNKRVTDCRYASIVLELL